MKTRAQTNQAVKSTSEKRGWEAFPEPQGWAMKWAHGFEYKRNGHNGHHGSRRNGNGAHPSDRS
jgi:hypothetical protein